jgi:DNA-binding response OmpR family regulator
MKLLLIEDSPLLVRSLGLGLRRLGHTVDVASNGREGYELARLGGYDAIVLDIMLPEMDGLSVLRQLRAAGDQTHVLILSARDQLPDRVRGLDLGADDYLVKPFEFDELRARLDSLGRRRFEQKSPAIELGTISINTARREAQRDGAVLPLTRGEYAVLEYLAQNRGRVRTREQIAERLGESASNVADVMVYRLRKKLQGSGGDDVIKTRRGFGYYVE